MKAKNNFQKYKYYIKKRKEVLFHSLRKSQIEGRKIGPKVVLNSLPKSGTHLLETLFLNLPLMRHNGKKTLGFQTQNSVSPKLKVIKSLKKGQFLLAHMQYRTSIIDTVLKNDIKIVHLIRDPRDVILSHLSYIETMDTTQKAHKFIVKFNSKTEKIKAMLEGKKEVLEPFGDVLNKFKPWLDNEKVLCLKFEDLIGEKGGGNNLAQTQAVKKICNYLNINVQKDELEAICQKIYSPKSSTFNKGKIGNWKQSLSSEEQELINKVIKEQIQKYGY